VQIDKALLESVPIYPDFRVLCFGEFDDEFLELIISTIEQENGTILLYSDSQNSKYERITNKKIEDGFRVLSRDFELVIVRDINCKITEHAKLFNKFYNTLENSGRIIAYTVDTASKDTNEALELAEFRSVNCLKEDGVSIFTGKKMHMWKNDLS
jgi:hypothetical protein